MGSGVTRKQLPFEATGTAASARTRAREARARRGSWTVRCVCGTSESPIKEIGIEPSSIKLYCCALTWLGILMSRGSSSLLTGSLHESYTVNEEVFMQMFWPRASSQPWPSQMHTNKGGKGYGSS